MHYERVHSDLKYVELTILNFMEFIYRYYEQDRLNVLIELPFYSRTNLRKFR